MQIKKEILLFYVLILVFAGIVIAADQPTGATNTSKPRVKCCNINDGRLPKDSVPPLYFITEGLLRFKA